MHILDTNVLLRFLLGDNGEMAQKARELIQTKKILVPIEVVAEIVFVLSKVYGIDRKKIQSMVLQLMNTRNIYTPDNDLIICAIKYYAEGNLDFVDCLMIGYKKTGRYEVFTFDKALSKFLS